jgi:hypothetical protein
MNLRNMNMFPFLVAAVLGLGAYLVAGTRAAIWTKFVWGAIVCAISLIS